ncbi:MAG: outer membrane protein assembly factor BamE [Pseudomonadota bacterium]
MDEEKVAQVTLGMTRNQVRFLLGTPLVDDPFNRDRWDYLYYITPSRSDTVEKRWITLYFDNNSVVRIVRDDPPEGAEDTVEGSTEA